MTVRVVSLDFWGTLYFHVRTPVYRKQIRRAAIAGAAQRLCLSNAENIADRFFETADAYVKSSWKEGIAPKPLAVLEHLCRSFGRSMSTDIAAELLEVIYDVYLGALKPRPVAGALDILGWVAARWPLYLVSDTYTLTGRVIEKILESDGLRDLFSGRFYSDELGVQKPSPVAIQKIAQQETVPTSAIVHVGDLWERDAELARASGCRCILLPTAAPNSATQASPEHKYTVVQCESFLKLPEILNAFD